MAHYTILLIDLTLGKHLQILGKTQGGYVQKWHLRYKPAISLTRSSLEPKLLQSVYRNSCTAYRLVTNLMTYSVTCNRGQGHVKMSL